MRSSAASRALCRRFTSAPRFGPSLASLAWMSGTPSPASSRSYRRAGLRAAARIMGGDERTAVPRLESILPAVEAELPPAAEPEPRVRSEYVFLMGAAVLVVWMLGWGPFARSGRSVAPAVIEVAP